MQPLKQRPENEELTKESLRKFTGLETLTEKEAEEALENLEKIAKLFYKLVHTQNQNKQEWKD